MCNILNNRSAKTIDILLSVSILLGFLSNLWGIIKIDWTITSEIYQGLFIYSSTTLAISFLFSLIIMCVRKTNIIFTDWNLSTRALIYFFEVINLIGLIIVLVCYFYVSRDVAKPIINMTEYNFGLGFFIKRQWSIVFYSFSLTAIFYDLQFPLWYSSLKRLKLKTNGSLREGEFVIIND